VVLVNSNPATIMTDPERGTAKEGEPMLPRTEAQVIEREQTNTRLPTLGGQTALNLAKALHEDGTLQRHEVELIGADYEAIDRAEDRERFRETMTGAGLRVPRSAIALRQSALSSCAVRLTSTPRSLAKARGYHGWGAAAAIRRRIASNGLMRSCDIRHLARASPAIMREVPAEVDSARPGERGVSPPRPAQRGIVTSRSGHQGVDPPRSPGPVVRFADMHVVVVDKPPGLTTMRHADEAAEITHGNLVANCELQRVYVGSGDDDVALGVLPWFHITGMECQMNMMAYLGATLVAIGRFDLTTVLRAIEMYRCTRTTFITTVNVAVVNFPGTKSFDLSSLRNCFSGGPPVLPAVAQRLDELTGHKLVDGYGLNDIAPPTHIIPPQRSEYAAVGLPALLP